MTAEIHLAFQLWRSNLFPRGTALIYREQKKTKQQQLRSTSQETADTGKERDWDWNKNKQHFSSSSSSSFITVETWHQTMEQTSCLSVKSMDGIFFCFWPRIICHLAQVRWCEREVRKTPRWRSAEGESNVREERKKVAGTTLQQTNAEMINYKRRFVPFLHWFLSFFFVEKTKNVWCQDIRLLGNLCSQFRPVFQINGMKKRTWSSWRGYARSRTLIFFSFS